MVRSWILLNLRHRAKLVMDVYVVDVDLRNKNIGAGMEDNHIAKSSNRRSSPRSQKTRKKRSLSNTGSDECQEDCQITQKLMKSCKEKLTIKQETKTASKRSSRKKDKQSSSGRWQVTNSVETVDHDRQSSANTIEMKTAENKGRNTQNSYDYGKGP